MSLGGNYLEVMIYIKLCGMLCVCANTQHVVAIIIGIVDNYGLRFMLSGEMGFQKHNMSYGLVHVQTMLILFNATSDCDYQTIR